MGRNEAFGVIGGMKTPALELILVPKGTRIKIEGIPFWLPDDTVLEGLSVNWELAKKWSSKSRHPSIPTNFHIRNPRD